MGRKRAPAGPTRVSGPARDPSAEASCAGAALGSGRRGGSRGRARGLGARACPRLRGGDEGVKAPVAESGRGSGGRKGSELGSGPPPFPPDGRTPLLAPSRARRSRAHTNTPLPAPPSRPLASFSPQRRLLLTHAPARGRRARPPGPGARLPAPTCPAAPATRPSRRRHRATQREGAACPARCPRGAAEPQGPEEARGAAPARRAAG